VLVMSVEHWRSRPCRWRLTAVVGLAVIFMAACGGGGGAAVEQRSTATGTILFFRQVSAGASEYALFRVGVRSGACSRVRVLGSSYAALLSPNGRYVGFAEPSTRILDTRNGSSTLLAGAPAGWFTWSRNSESVAFVAAGRPHIVNTRGVTTNRFASAPGGAWSPDGRQVAFTRTTGDGRAGTLKTVLVIAPSSNLNAGEVVYDEPNSYGFSPAAAWAPDSQTVYYRAEDETIALDTATGHQRRVHKGYVGGTWSPDNQRILFTTGGPWGVEDVFVMNNDGSNRRRLTTTRPPERGVPQHGSVGLGWSPDGAWIVVGRKFELAVMRADGSHKRTLCRFPVGVAPFGASWNH
jgi:Tol biopolymer transport system component